MSVIRWIDQRRHWWKVFVVIFAVSVTVVGYIGYQTYQYAPPIVNFVDEQGEVVFPAESVTRGQQVFQKYGLMDYGSYLGDGGMRGLDFTAEALHLTARLMAAVLFLGSGLIGISHNFYWNAKSIETVALGGVLSSLQVAPLVLLTVEAWRFRNMPAATIRDARRQNGNGKATTFGLAEPFLFLVGVNFWNFLGPACSGS